MIDVLRTCPLGTDLESRLASKYKVWTIEDLDAGRVDAQAVRAVVTGGHIGLPPALGERLPRLEIVSIYGVGFDKVDLPAARSRGLRVSNTPDVLTDDVADLAIGLMVDVLRRVSEGDRFVREGRWLTGGLPLARKVTGRRFGILGLGRIGRAIAKRLGGFGGEIGYANNEEVHCEHRYFQSPVALADWCDVLIVAAAASPSTNGLVGREVLGALGPNGFLVNVSRGSLVDEKALVSAIVEERIAGAALDVFADEPHVPQELRSSPRVVMTPHVASATVETRRDMADLVLLNLQAHFDGKPLLTPVV